MILTYICIYMYVYTYIIDSIMCDKYSFLCVSQLISLNSSQTMINLYIHNEYGKKNVVPLTQ